MNRKLAFYPAAAAAVVLLGSAAIISSQEMPKPKTNAGFEQLKSLAGGWEGVNSHGKPSRVEYQVVSNGSALMERLLPAAESEMMTRYSPDGQRVAVTHYCNVGNQPQMQTESLTGPTQKFTFNFVRATNLGSPGAGHMEKLVVTIQDREHLTQEWSFIENGKVAHTEVFHPQEVVSRGQISARFDAYSERSTKTNDRTTARTKVVHGNTP